MGRESFSDPAVLAAEIGRFYAEMHRLADGGR